MTEGKSIEDSDSIGARSTSRKKILTKPSPTDSHLIDPEPMIDRSRASMSRLPLLNALGEARTRIHRLSYRAYFIAAGVDHENCHYHHLDLAHEFARNSVGRRFKFPSLVRHPQPGRSISPTRLKVLTKMAYEDSTCEKNDVRVSSCPTRAKVGISWS